MMSESRKSQNPNPATTRGGAGPRSESGTLDSIRTPSSAALIRVLSSSQAHLHGIAGGVPRMGSLECPHLLRRHPHLDIGFPRFAENHHERPQDAHALQPTNAPD